MRPWWTPPDAPAERTARGVRLASHRYLGRMPKVIVVGSTGQVGRAVVADFAAAGWDVTAVHRGRQAVPPSWGEFGVSDVVADRSEPGQLEAALAPGADAVVDVVGFDAADGRQLLAAQDDIGSLVVVSTVDVYVDDAGRGLEDGRDGVENFPRYDLPIREDNPTWAPDRGTYGSDKVALEQTLRDGARVPVTSLRPGGIHGPGSRTPRELWVVLRALAGQGSIPLAMAGGHALPTTATTNLARLALRSAEDALRGSAPGFRAFNSADPDALSVTEIVRALLDALGSTAEIVPLGDPDPESPRFVAEPGATPWSIPRSMALDLSAAASVGYEPVHTYAQAAPAAVASVLERLEGRAWHEAYPDMARAYGETFGDVSAEEA